jgi:hypothetical protein
MFKCYICNSKKSYPENISETFQIDGKFYLVEKMTFDEMQQETSTQKTLN